MGGRKLGSNVLVLTGLGFLAAAYGLVYAGRPTVPAAPLTAPPLVRPIPAACEAFEARGASWNALYQAGFSATRRGDHEAARVAMCQALHAVRDADPNDWRFAETLDELGLVYFRLGDYAMCATVQGLAVAEIQLAQGPDSADAAMYIARLGIVYRQLGRAHEIDALAAEPYRIFAEPDLLWGPWLRERVTWLVAEYLKRENLVAATFLRERLGE